MLPAAHPKQTRAAPFFSPRDGRRFALRGGWLKSDTVTYDVPAGTGLFDAHWIVNVQPEGEHELLAMELCSNRAMLPQLLKGEPLELGTP